MVLFSLLPAVSGRRRVMRKTSFLACLACLVAFAGLPYTVAAQDSASSDKVRDGLFEITLKSPDKRTIVVDEIVRDRDLNPGAIYRVKAGGYLAFDESEWVDKIEFKVFDRPVTQLAPYKRYANLLVDINEKIWAIKQMLGSYDQLAFRLMNICDKSRFPSLQSIDDNIVQQLTIYKKLELLRSLVVNSLNRFVRDRSCIDRYGEYQKSLNLYSQQLMELGKNYERLTKRALTLAQESTTDQSAPEKPAPPPPASR
jgi:hypothetical protein